MAPISPGRALVSGAGLPSPAARNASNVETALSANRVGKAAGASSPTMASRPGAGPSTPSNACTRRASATTIAGAALSTWCARNAPLSSMLIGTMRAPAFMAPKKAMRISGPLPSSAITRSPGPTPQAASAAANRSDSRSRPAKVSAAPPSKVANTRRPCSRARARTRCVIVQSGRTRPSPRTASPLMADTLTRISRQGHGLRRVQAFAPQGAGRKA